MKGSLFLKKIIYIVWGVVSKMAYMINFFDQKPKVSLFPFQDSKRNLAEPKDIFDTYAIVIHTFDEYTFLWKGCIHFFEKYWTDTGKIHKYFLSDYSYANFPGWESILTGGGAWNQRLLTGLTSIDQDYIVYLQEDFWFCSPVDTKIIHELVSFCRSYDIPLLKLHDPGSEYILETTDKNILGKPITRVNKNSSYLISHAISIWKKDFLIEILHGASQESPWENEIKGTLRMKFARDTTFHIYQYNMFSRDPSHDESCWSAYREVCRKGEYNSNIKGFIDVLL